MIPLQPLVSLDRARDHVGTLTDRDDDLRSKLSVASAIVANHIKITEIPEEWVISNDSPPVEYDPEDISIIETEDSPATVIRVPGNISAAVVLVLTELYENREASTSQPLSPAVEALLAPYRDPSFA